jgi:hypothetical protein
MVPTSLSDGTETVNAVVVVVVGPIGVSDSSGMEDRAGNSRFREWVTSSAIASLSDSERN